MAVQFDDSSVRESLYPFTATRNVADIRIGILTIREKWDMLLQKNNLTISADTVIDPSIIPTRENVNTILSKDEETLAHDHHSHRIRFPWHIFQLNDWALRNDFELITEGRKSAPVDPSNAVISPENIFIEEGATVTQSIINASTGPVYIGKNATVMEGCIIRGPFSLGEGAVLKMGAKIYGATTIGPFCNAGGEIKNSVMFAYSNKAHDGYLGDSVIGAWCNLGAGTANSNVLNTAGDVKVWQQDIKAYTPVGLKCGLIMGDYSRAAINTSFNTGTTVGVCCNIFGSGFPSKMIPHFSWGQERYIFEKALKDIANWKALKGHLVTEEEKQTLNQLYVIQ